MIAYLISCLLWSPSLIGYGCLLDRVLFGKRTAASTYPNLGEMGLWGYVLLALLAVLFHFLFPLVWFISVLCLFLGWAFLGYFANGIINSFSIKVCLAFGLICFATVVVILGLGYSFDTGLYHVPLVISAKKLPLVIGYGNLYMAYGRPSFWYPLGALMWLPGLGLFSAFSIQSLLFAFFMLHVFCRLTSEEQGSMGRAFSRTFLVVILFCVPFVIVSIRSLSGDFPVMIYGIYSWLLFIEFLESSEDSNRWKAEMTLMASVFAVICKLSAVPWLMVGGSAYLIMLWGKLIKNEWKARTWIALVFSRAFLFVLGLFLIWIIRGLLLTGCPAYPQPQACIHSLPWALSSEDLSLGIEDIRKMNVGEPEDKSPVLGSSRVPEWLRKAWISPPGLRIKILVVFGLLFLILSAFWSKKQKLSSEAKRLVVFAIVAVFGMLGLWILSLPTIRFGLGYLMALAGMILGAGLFRLGWKGKMGEVFVWLFFMGSLGLGVRTMWVTRAEPISWTKWSEIPRQRVEKFTEIDGYEFFRPAQDYRCWDHQPYCLPEIRPIQIIGKFMGYPVFGNKKSVLSP